MDVMNGHEEDQAAALKDKEIQRLKHLVNMKDQEIRRLKMIIESAYVDLGKVFKNFERGFMDEDNEMLPFQKSAGKKLGEVDLFGAEASIEPEIKVYHENEDVIAWAKASEGEGDIVGTDRRRLTGPNDEVKFVCSYGGMIHPRPYDDQLCYIGGETKILTVDRNINFSDMTSKLSDLCGDTDLSFKYKFLGQDLDALISVTNDDELQDMMREYLPGCMQLFLAPVKPSPASFLSEDDGSDLVKGPDLPEVYVGSGHDVGVFFFSDE